MFPYPSGDLHTGHWYAVAPSDAAARYRRMLGYNVMFPMGFDAFGLPAENAAIRRGVDPKEWTYANIERMRGQLKAMGAMFDWDREIASCDPDYYRWTQWWFLKLYERGLAYRAEAAANWCPGCQTVLANEQVLDGRCERSDDVVERRFLTQWFFRITDYADELLRFDGLEWPERIQTMQRNWIGRSEGARLHFGLDVEGVDERLTVFTTRPDTVYGATFMVLAPEHPLVGRITTDAQRSAVDEYVRARLPRHRDRAALDGAGEDRRVHRRLRDQPLQRRSHPDLDRRLRARGPTGRARSWPCPRTTSATSSSRRSSGSTSCRCSTTPRIDVSKSLTEAFTAGGRMINSGPFDGTAASDAIGRVTSHAEGEGVGEGAITYRLRDWLISRQRYWGAPHPDDPLRGMRHRSRARGGSAGPPPRERPLRADRPVAADADR